MKNFQRSEKSFGFIILVIFLFALCVAGEITTPIEVDTPQHQE